MFDIVNVYDLLQALGEQTRLSFAKPQDKPSSQAAVLTKCLVDTVHS